MRILVSLLVFTMSFQIIYQNKLVININNKEIPADLGSLKGETESQEKGHDGKEKAETEKEGKIKYLEFGNPFYISNQRNQLITKLSEKLETHIFDILVPPPENCSQVH
ncbi:MAG: hypothetical protein HC811_06745 [Flammeovirgaceae bacterium]|nr:hypothetical protein [Flammeovirgaceae bacterium]